MMCKPNTTGTNPLTYPPSMYSACGSVLNSLRGHVSRHGEMKSNSPTDNGVRAQLVNDIAKARNISVTEAETIYEGLRKP